MLLTTCVSALARSKQTREAHAAPHRNCDQFIEALKRTHHATNLVALHAMNHRAIFGAHRKHRVRECKIDQRISHATIVEDIARVLAAQHLIERRLRDEDLALLDQLAHMTKEEGEQQRANVRTVDIGVCHDDDAAVAQLCDVEVFTDAALKRLNKNADFLEAEDFVETRLLNIDQLAAQRKNRLIHVIAAALGASTCGITLDNEEFSLLNIIR